MYFVGFYCIRFKIKLVKIAQEIDLVTWFASGATREGHMRSTCWKLKSQWVSWLISQLTRWPAKCTDNWDFKCDSYTLHPYYIYPHYPQDCKEAIQKKTLERFLQHTYHLRESYSSLSENSLVVSSPFPLSLLYLERRFVLKHNSYLFRV